jgi:hypothetical protein
VWRGSLRSHADSRMIRVMQPSAARGGTELESSRCAVHPELPAVAVCERCGDYHCTACRKQVAGRALCASCRSLPGVDYLEDTRRRFWGKRDGFTYYFGLVGPVSILASLPTVLRAGDAGHILSSAIWMGLSLAYLAQYRPMRLGLLLFSCLDMLVDAARVALGMPVVPTGKSQLHAPTLPLVLIGITFSVLVAIAAYQSPRNKLAFKIAVDDSDLQRVYDRYLSNPLAVRAAVYGSLCVFIPFANVITLVMGIRALRRADAEAWPPRSGRLPARIGVALSSVGLLGWAALTLRIVLLAHR